jgi:hypothetical protein
MPVVLEEDGHSYEVMETSLLNFENGLIRHDAAKIRETVEELLESV